MPSMEQVKELRSLTGCAIMDCKEALTEAGDDIDQAVANLRKKGKAHAAKKADRATAEGVIGTYIHTNGKIGVMVSLQCESDFVSKNEKFQALARDIAMHIAATDPVAISPDDIPAELVEQEQAIAEEMAKESGKPADIQAKMIAGKISKFKEERALLKQPFVKDPSKTITELINESVSELGENITIGEFARLDI